MKVLVFGGTGNISGAIVREFRARGDEVWSFHRKSHDLGVGEHQLIGDKYDKAAAEALLAGHVFDVVVDMICFNPGQADALVDLVARRTAHIVVASTGAVYRRPCNAFPIREDREAFWTAPGNPYAFDKAAMEMRLATLRDGAGMPPITIVRPSLNFSPGCTNVGVLRQNRNIVERLRAGKSLVMFGDGKNPWQFTFAPDMAKAFAGVAGNARAFGHVYHYANPEVRAFEDMYLEIGRAVGIEPRMVYLPSTQLDALNPDLFHHLVVEKQYPGVFDSSAIESIVPGLCAEWPLARGMRDMVAWWEQSGFPLDPAKDALEDKLVVLNRYDPAAVA